jgi:hypothetical protein
MSAPRIKANHHPKHFIKDEKLSIHASHSEGKITKFTATKEGVTKEFPVKKHDILAAWQEMEQWLGKLIDEPVKPKKK